MQAWPVAARLLVAAAGVAGGGLAAAMDAVCTLPDWAAATIITLLSGRILSGANTILQIMA